MAGRSREALILGPAYAVAGVAAFFFVLIVLVLGVFGGVRVVNAVRDRRAPTYSLDATRRCLQDRHRDVTYRAPGSDFGRPRLIVAPYRRGGITERTELWFFPTPREARESATSDSEPMKHRGNVVFAWVGVDADPAIDECLG